MAKVDHLQQLRGRNLNDTERNRPKQKFMSQTFRRKIIDSKPAQEQALKNYIRQETEFYNQLIETLQAKLRATPEFFNQLTDEHVRLFGLLCRLQYDVNQLAHKKSKNTELPEHLEIYRDLLFGIHGGKELGLSDKYQIFYEVCANRALVHPEVKERMALELLEWCQRQATILKNKDYSREQSYKHSPETIEKVSTLQKRHLQIPKSLIKWEYSENDECTKLWIPHLKSPLKVDSDLNDAPQQWNLIIVHQDPNSTTIGRNIHWEIDFKKTQNRYLIKYLESANPIGKMQSRFVGLKM